MMMESKAAFAQPGGLLATQRSCRLRESALTCGRNRHSIATVHAPRARCSGRPAGWTATAEDARPNEGATSESRRQLLSGALSAAAASALSLIPPAKIASAAASTETVSTAEMSVYQGPISLGYSFQYPATGWSVKKKPIKTHLAELLVSHSDGTKSSATVGVTVDAVKIGKIEDFGSPTEVGEKVAALERRKDNVLTAEVLATRKVEGDGLSYYVVEYEVDGGRGKKRFIAKATITGGNLYVFTAQAKLVDFEGEDGVWLARMVDSFTVKAQYM